VLIQLLAGAVLLFLVFSLFRFAMGLRWAKVSREAARAAAEDAGRQVVAELPLPTGEVAFLVEDAQSFAWQDRRVAKAGIFGVRMRLNGGVLAEHARDGVRLPPPEVGEEYEGRERWDVAVFSADGALSSIPCGVLREGVSREVASTVFAAVKRAMLRGGGPASSGASSAEGRRA
jgi:hypothetical protein